MAGRLPGFSSPFTLRVFNPLTKPKPSQCVRHLHRTVKAAAIPKPTPFVPDTKTLLTLIGRDMSKYASKLESWDQMFTMTSQEMRENLGMESARDRKYLIRWREKFRRQEFGVGGDLDAVVDGVAELRAVEVPVVRRQQGQEGESTTTMTTTTTTTEQGEGEGGKEQKLPPVFAGSATLSPGMKWVIVNLPPGETKSKEPLSYPSKKYAEFKLYNGNMIKGPYVKAVKGANGSAVQVSPVPGMWEHKLGRKIDGGERRQAEVRAKKRIAERKAASA